MLLLTVTLSGFAEEDVDEKFREKILKNSLENVRLTIAVSDTVKVFKLDGRTDADRGFPIKPNGEKAFAGIVREVKMSPKDLVSFKALFKDIGNDEWLNQALCHQPAYGFRLYKRGDLFFETSVCFHCNNWYLSVLDSSLWAPLGNAETRASMLGFFQATVGE